MSHLRNNLFFLLLCAVICVSCGFMDLRQIEFNIEPDTPYSILAGPYSPVIVKFNTEMEKSSEKILQVSSDTGVMRGDISWNGNDLYFIPVSGWTAGTRYTLSLLGTIRSVDGRELRIEHFIPFYAINNNEPPLLQWHYPADGGSISTADLIFEYHFSRSMDRLTTESALTIDGIGNRKYEWENEDKILKVFVDKALSPWVSYRWNLKDSAKSTDGVPLPKTYSGFFTTDMDQTLPRVTGIFPVLSSGGSWFPTGASFETGLASGQGISIEFNKPMGENVLRSVRFDPALSGRTEFLSEKSIVYIFTKDPEPETTYTLIVSADTRDKEGLKIGAEYRINFVPDIPFLDILSFSAGINPVIHNNFQDAIIPVHIDPGTDVLSFTVRFSLPFNTEEKQNSAQKIILTPFFPKTLAPVALQNVNWINNDRLFMCWEGLKNGSSETPFYYKLTIPGGKNGINNGTGMYLKEDITIYLEAVNEK